MDKLRDKSKKQYGYVSRYSSFPYYYHTEDDKFIYGITSNLKKDVPYVEHKVTDTDTLDTLAYKYYGRPDYYWIIADFNNIQDPMMKLSVKFKTIKVPSINNITFKD